VAEKSSEISVDITLDRDMALPLIYNECATGKIIIKPTSPIRNAAIICSHSNMFGF